MEFNFWISLGVNGILLLIIFFQRRQVRILKRQLPNVEIDDIRGTSGGDLFNNITKAKKLAKELKVKIHPDKFLDESTRLVAESLYQQVAANSTNYPLLMELRDKIEDFL